MKVEFHAALFGVVSSPVAALRGERVRVRRGAFAAALRVGPAPRLMVDHDAGLDAHLLLKEDHRGLRVTATIQDGRLAGVVYAAIKAGVCLGASFRYAGATWGRAAGGVVDLVSVARLVDVALMVERPPCFPQTRRFVRACSQGRMHLAARTINA